MTKKLINGNQAAAIAAWLANPQVIAAYPITPQTSIIEELAKFVAENPRKKVEYITVESEYSALAICAGASLTGARTFTATSSQGLLYMAEMIHYVSGLRMPIVMSVVSRGIYGPSWILGTDQNDVLSQRDAGWLMFFCENNQEVLDTLLLSYKIAETPKVSLPVIVVSEGFILSHTYEPVDIPDKKDVGKYLPIRKNPLRRKIDFTQPSTIGATTTAPVYMEMKRKAHQAMLEAEIFAEEASQEFQKRFGRTCDIIERYGPEDADILLITSGTASGVAKEIVDETQNRGSVAVLKIKMFRPFPIEKIRKLAGNAKKIAVIDRNISPGIGGIFCQEIKAAFQNNKNSPSIFGFIDGLGGRDIKPGDIRWIIDYTHRHSEAGKESIWVPDSSERKKE